ncbi:MAG TPA: AAA family ATPase [Candidatus Sulfotelmatobacter sp.]|jgi:pilus assembly protein CpaE|nr:AAA family ATPase [Candidatus Sulfotelmatobacter sp.]
MLYRLTLDAFAATPAFRAAVEALAADPLFAKCQIGLYDGGLAAAVTHYHAQATPQLVLVEEPGDAALLQQRLAQLAEVCVAGTRVMVAGAVNDISVYRRLLADGVSDYLVTPLSAEQVIRAVQALFADPAAAPKGRMVAFYGARGGVGSSTLAQNAAWNLAKAGDEVIYLDMDLAFGTSSLAFNADPRQTVGEMLGEPERIDTQLLDRILVKQDDRLRLLPAAAELRDLPPIEVEAVEHLFDLARRMAAVLVVDLPHLWSPWIAHALDSADELVLTAAPDLASLRDAKALLELLTPRRQGRPIRLVLNKIDAAKRNQLTSKDFAETLKQPTALTLVQDAVFVEAANSGQMLAEKSKSNRAVEAFRQFSLSLSGRAAPKAAEGGLSALARRLKEAVHVR